MTFLAKSLILFKLLLALICVFTSVSFAGESSDGTVEQHYEKVQGSLAQFRHEVSVQDRQRMRSVPWKNRFQLSPRLRAPYEKWYELSQKEKLWEAAVDLKGDLLALQAPSLREQVSVQAEADRLTQSIIGVFRDKGEEWNMMSSALMNNMLINMKIREHGFCWHWVEAFMQVLYPQQWQYYDLYWGVAHLGSMLENNSLVITAKDQAFADGVMIDAWRTSGRPFWRIAREDRFPWVERKDIRITYCDGKVCTVANEEWVDPDS